MLPGLVEPTDPLFPQLTAALGNISALLCQNVIPLFVNNSAGIPIQCGCGFFVASENSHFLISAAHVFDEIRNGGEFFYPIGNNLNKHLSGQALLTPLNGKPRISDRLDIGVLKLEEPALPPYPAIQKQSLPITALKPNALPRKDKQYTLVGFQKPRAEQTLLTAH